MKTSDWLAEIYSDERKGKADATIARFVTAMNGDANLKAEAATKLTELEAMIAARGETACAYSTKYRNYLVKAFAS